MPTPRMLLVDLDGTTLDARRQLSPVDVEAARRLSAAGVPVTIATGRLFTGTRWVAEALGVQGSVAVMNGSELVDVASGTPTLGRYLDREVRWQLHRVLAESGLGTFVFGSRRIHYGEAQSPHAPYLAIWTEDLTQHPDIFYAQAWSDDDVLAVGIVGHAAPVAAVQDQLKPLLPDEIETVLFNTLDGHAFLKVRHGAEDKGTALARLAAERGFEAADVVAIGDWINDLPMLRTAGRSFAMAHAKDEVKATAHEVLDASRDGGAIAEVARRVWNV